MLSLEQICYDIEAGEPHSQLETRILYAEELPTDQFATGEQGATPVIFIPDLHLISDERARGYGDNFNLSHRRKGVLLSLLHRLLELRDGPTRDCYGNLAVYQLGDFHDLWREMDHWWGDDINDMMDRQINTHGDLFAYLQALRVQRLVGNHDNKLRVDSVRRRLATAPISSYFPIEHVAPGVKSIPWGAHQRIDMLHADQVDSGECSWYSIFNPLGARMAGTVEGLGIEEADEWKHELIPAGHPDPPGERALVPNVIRGDRSKQEKKGATKFFGGAWKYLQKEDRIDSPYRGLQAFLTVIGHTHFPRIVTDDSGQPYTMADCGSWVNFTTDSGPGGITFWNSQIGILTGNQIGIVQIGFEEKR